MPLFGLLLSVLFVLCHGAPTITYQVTVRDFLPIWCLSEVEFLALDINDPDIDEDNYDNQRGVGVCPYADYLASQEISGHPDFHRPVSTMS